MMKDIFSKIEEYGILPIMFAENPSDAQIAVQAIERTPINVIEILQRGETGLETLSEALKYRTNAYIGAGSVLNLEQCKLVLSRGADFIVSPGFDYETVTYCTENDIPIIPGVSTPTEIMAALNAGTRLIKFFPFIEGGGEPYLSMAAGPFADIRFVITGGLDERHFPYLINPKIAAIGGVWMFCTETDHTLKKENEIVDFIEKGINVAKHYKNLRVV